MRPLRVGLIGYGRLAQRVHLSNLTSLPEFELVAVAEPDASRRQGAARLAPRAQGFASYEELLDGSDTEAVLICLPNALHAVAALSALERGKHVYLEKPLALNTAEARVLIKAWRRAGVVAMTGFNYRFNKLYEEVRARLRSGALGKLILARTVFSTAAKAAPQWKRERRSGGGALFDLAAHHLDLVRYFFEQEVTEVFASIESRHTEDDTVLLEIRLADGMAIQSFFSTSGVEEDSFEIYGERGKLSVNRYLSLDVRLTDATLDGARLKQLKHGLRSLARAPYLFEKMGATEHEPSYRTALQCFARAARRGEQPKPDFFDGYYNLKIIEAAERSARAGSRVEMLDYPMPEYA